MHTRINPSRLNTRKLHHDAIMYLLRLCANLKVLHDAGQPFRADPSTLESWSTHRRDLEGCTELVIRFSQYGQYPEGEMSKHVTLLLAASRIISELKLRNIGESVSEITLAEVEALERMAMQLDCRERTVFY